MKVWKSKKHISFLFSSIFLTSALFSYGFARDISKSEENILINKNDGQVDQGDEVVEKTDEANELENDEKVDVKKPISFNQKAANRLVNLLPSNQMIRSGPSGGASLVVRMAPDNFANIIGQTEKYWHVNYAGKTGYLVKASVATLDPGDVTWMVSTAGSSLNLRDKPSSSGTVRAKIPSGGRVQALHYKDGWYRVIYNDVVGWASGSYLRYENYPSGDKISVTSSPLNESVKIKDSETNSTKITSNYMKDASGRQVYCLHPHMETPYGSEFVKRSREGDGVYRILKHGYPNVSLTGNAYVDRVLTQFALWSFVEPQRVDINKMTVYNGSSVNSSYFNIVRDLYNKGAHGGETQSVRLNFSTTSASAGFNGGSYETGYMSMNGSGDNIKDSTIRLSFVNANTGASISGISIILENGSSVSSVKMGQKFKLRIPQSQAGVAVKVRSSGDVMHTVAYSYKSLMRGTQDVAVLEDIWESVNASNELIVQCEQALGNLKIIKKGDSGELLEGAKFKLQQNGHDKTGIHVTDKNGNTFMGNIPAGQYTLIEVEAPWGYKIAEPRNINIKADSTETVEVINIRDRGNFKVIKKDEKGNLLKGAKFQLQLSDKIAQGPLETNSDGEVIFTNMPTGGYSLVEVLAPEGYLIDGSQNWKIIEVDSSRLNEQIITNKRIKGNIHVKKEDALDPNLKLSGAEFKLYDEDNKLIATQTTNSDGVAKFENVEYGKYTVKESKPPVGYDLSSEVAKFDIRKDGETYNCSIKDIRSRDFSVESYNVKDSSNKMVGTLRKGKTYRWNLKLKNHYYNLTLPNNPILGTGKIDKVKYSIAINDGSINQSLSSITVSNIEGKKIASGSLNDITIPDESFVWKDIQFTLPNEDKYSEIVFVAEIESSVDRYAPNNKIVVKMPILNPNDVEVDITNVDIYPGKDKSAIVGNDVNVKVDVSMNTLRTYDPVAKIKVKFPDGTNKVYERKVYGVSLENSGTVYFKFKPTQTGNYSITATVSAGGKSDTFPSKAFTVVDPKNPSEYEKATPMVDVGYNTNNLIETYLKVEKRDKDIIKVRYCPSHCQVNDVNNISSCPGHEFWEWGNWYSAYVLKKNTNMTGIKESFNINSVKFRSKSTDINKSYYNEIDGSGYIELLEQNSFKYAKVKSGYGFEMKIETQYNNNLPEVFSRAHFPNNIAPVNTTWAQYKTLSYTGNKIPLIYYPSGGKTIDQEIESKSGAIEITVPSMSDLIIESPNQIYLKMPDGEYLIANEGYKTRYSDGIQKRLGKIQPSGIVKTDNLYTDKKTFEIVKPTKDGKSKRSYFIDEKVKDKTYGMKVFNRYAGYGLNESKRLHGEKNVKIYIDGGRYDDLKGTNE